MLSPIYRSLTIQFKVYIQFSAMTVGGMIEADRRLRAFELMQVREKRRRKHEGGLGAVYREGNEREGRR